MLYLVDETCFLRFSYRLFDIGKLVQERRKTNVTEEISDPDKKIGKGSFGEVYKAKWTYYSHGGERTPTTMDVAVKKLSRDVIAGTDEVRPTRSSMTLS
jgi:hypothetical protein